MQRQAHNGLAILSRTPFLETKNTYLYKNHLLDFDKISMDDNVQNLQHVVVVNQNQQIHILNYHGHYVREHKNGNEETVRLRF